MSDPGPEVNEHEEIMVDCEECEWSAEVVIEEVAVPQNAHIDAEIERHDHQLETGHGLVQTYYKGSPPTGRGERNR